MYMHVCVHLCVCVSITVTDLDFSNTGVVQIVALHVLPVARNFALTISTPVCIVCLYRCD